MIEIGLGKDGLVVTTSPEPEDEAGEQETPVGWKVYEFPPAMVTMAFSRAKDATRYKVDLRKQGFSGRIKAVYADGEERDLWDLRVI